ncbi:MAG: (d)CMP kinase [Chlamydiia bacterium]|nr:(d)CMP kinase [Chlamydiia bacterium]
MIITIDGPVATGKSTIAKKLANALGYIYYDTGAMYRALSLDALRKKVDLSDEEALLKFLEGFNFKVKMHHGDRRYFIDGEEVTDDIRTEVVSNAASKVSAIPKVREKLVELQRNLSKGVNAVFEGRDMGTVVFPDADLKIYLVGDDKVRAERRFQELKAKFPEEAKSMTLDEVLQDLRLRDEFDMTREASPLKKADDAFEIDTTHATLDELVYKILECKDIAATRRKKQQEM